MDPSKGHAACGYGCIAWKVQMEWKGEAHEMMYNMRNDGKGWKCDEVDTRSDH